MISLNPPSVFDSDHSSYSRNVNNVIVFLYENVPGTQEVSDIASELLVSVFILPVKNHVYKVYRLLLSRTFYVSI